MFKNGKRLLSFLLAMVLLLSLMPAQAFAAEEASQDYTDLTEAVNVAAQAVTEAQIAAVAVKSATEHKITDYGTFMMYLAALEEVAMMFAMENPGTDPLELIIKYIRTGVDRYNSGSWGIMAGYENAEFAAYVIAVEEMLNAGATSEEEKYYISSLKNIENFYLPGGIYTDFGHMFGTMDITYHNATSPNHADVGGWAGDVVDLLSTADRHYVSGTLEEMVAEISENYLMGVVPGESDQFGPTDMFGDLDAYYIMTQLMGQEYEMGMMTELFMTYFTEDLSEADRAAYFLEHRLGGVSTRGAVRDAVYKIYTGNKVIATLEGTREFNATDLTDLRKASCYAFADYICRLAGDYVDVTENPYFTVFSSEYTTLAPGITQEIKLATTADNKQTVYYIATADLNRDDVDVHANYNDHDPSKGWAMQRVEDQANAAQAYHSNPEDENYIENFNVIAAVNGAGFNMQTGEPGGVLVMHGVEYQSITSAGFIGILKDGTPVIGTKEEYQTTYKGQVRDAIAVFGATLVKDGKITVTASDNYTNNRAGRTAAGITKTGKFVFMVMDGRQEPYSCGGSMEEIAQVMLEAGCVYAVNLDGGGSTTYVAKQPGEDALQVMNNPSDGFARSVSTSFFMVSTAPSSTAFDHAKVECEANYLTIGTQLQMTAVGISATGDPAELPEGYSWAVSDTRYAEITEDGLLTAKRLGEITVYVMLGEETIGTHTVTCVNPNNVYFTRDNMNAVYGSTITLPVKALYDNKLVATNKNDMVFQLSNDAAGTLDGNLFTVAEVTNLKNVTVAVILPNVTDEYGTPIGDTMVVSLFNQGEATFDFDKATGGNRQLAWDRKVSNATTEDNQVYQIADPNLPMESTYTFAIDMTQIPIPPQLEDLTTMLPGADMENASAWLFLLQLAERISPMSEVTPVIRFDENFEVDYSGLTLMTQYFELKETVFDEELNQLTLRLSWIDQTQAIDPETANPLCIVSGIKLTPKDDAQWDAKGQLEAVNSGKIGYKIYMRASALYSFAQKQENQQAYGIYPYVNPNDSKDAGGYFGSTYAEYEDHFTLVSVAKNGWVTEEGGFAYYVDGVALTGVQLVEGLYYDFGQNGLNDGKTPYSGLFTLEGITYYAKLGELMKGWQAVGDDWYLFNWQTGVGEHGTYQTKIDGVSVTYQFENGLLVKGYWHQDAIGLQYFYGPYYYKQGWREIDGETYFFENYYACTGVSPVRAAHAVVATWYEFTDTGALVGPAEDGLHWYKNDLYYIKDQVCTYTGFYLVDGAYYYLRSDYKAVVSDLYWTSNTNGLLPAGTYRFDSQGKAIMTTELVNENGTLYYYRDGRRASSAGLVLLDGSYYYIESGAIAAVSKSVWVGTTNGLLPAGTYRFGADGKMILNTELVEENGILYYYQDGKRTVHAGLIQFDGAYYFIDGQAQAVKNQTVWVTNTNDLWPVGSYEFGADGKMIIYNGIVGGYYYVNGVRTAAGLILVDGDYYFAGSGGKLVTDQKYWVGNTNGLLTAGTYRFGADGKINMATELANEDGILYYYRNGRRTGNAGVLLIDGDYYYVSDGAVAVADRAVWVSNTNGLVTAGTYRFDRDGKMIMTTEVAEESGVYYYYCNGLRTASAGLIEFDGAYYFIDGAAKALVNTTFWINARQTHGLWPEGSYEFGADGKMIIHNGIVGDYYYVNGIKTYAGLLQIDDSYYFAGTGGKLVKNAVHWVTAHWANDLVPEGYYRFDSQGKAIMTTEIANEDGTLYYYRNGKRTGNAGVLQIDGSYYYVYDGAIVIAGQTMWVSNTNGLVTAGTYRFAEDGKMIMTTEVVEENGVYYYYKNGCRTGGAGLIGLDGAYYFIDGAAKAAVSTTIWINGYQTHGLWPEGSYEFGADGKMIIYNGIVGNYYYVNGIKTYAGLLQIGGEYYFAGYGGKLVKNAVHWVTSYWANGLLAEGYYRFDSQGKAIMTTELVNEDGTLYYYRNGKRTANAGLLNIDGSYYYILSGAIAVTDQSIWVSNTNGLVTAGTYRFASDGKMIVTTEVVEENGTYYYYKNGLRTASAGLIKFDGAYYFIDGAAKAAVSTTIWVNGYQTHGLWPEGSYEFGADGKMVINNGIVGEYYYVNGIKTYAGLLQIGGEYYFAGYGGKLVKNAVHWVTSYWANDLLAEGYYRFDSEGKAIMTTEIVNEDGTLYYYRNGKRTGNAGVLNIDGSYYYVHDGAIVIAGQTMWVSNTNGLVTAGTYRFAEDGKMIMTTEVVEENGVYYYYRNGMRTGNAGIVKFDGAYYFIDGAAKAAVSTTIWINGYQTHGLWPEGSYEFGADGKMIIYNGIVGNYYYVNGIKTYAGLLQIDGEYYFAGTGGKLLKNTVHWITAYWANDLLAEGTYRFDSEGKAIMTTEIVNENGTLYYYRNGKRTGNAGVLLIDGSYYYVASGAIVVTSQSLWVSNTNGRVTEGTYRFAADGKMIMTTEVVEENGVYYYYRNGVRTGNAGIVKFDGAYYFIDGGAKALVNTTFWVSAAQTHGYWPEGSYEFGADGKMIIHNGIVGNYYYVEGIKTYAGLLQIDGSYYFAGTGGKLVKNAVHWVTSYWANGLLAEGYYRFDSQGKAIMTTEIVNEDGTLYYYRNGKRTGNAGVLNIDGSYYYVHDGAIVIAGQSLWVSNTNGLVTAGTYRFAADGKMIMDTAVVEEGGTYYYYRNGRRTANAGLVLYNDAYYYIDGAAKAVTGSVYVDRTNGLLAQGTYLFGEDGKLIPA